MLIQLNLPKPNTDLINYSIKIINDFEFAYRKLDWCKKTYGFNHSYADYEYYIDDYITSSTLTQFQCYFKYAIDKVYLIMNNSHDGLPRVMPPHTDKYRKTAINFYPKLGGCNSKLTLYKQYGSDQLNESDLAPYNQLSKESVHSLAENTWFGFNAKQFHSLENITSKRLCLALFFTEPFDQFCKMHSHLIS